MAAKREAVAHLINVKAGDWRASQGALQPSDRLTSSDVWWWREG